MFLITAYKAALKQKQLHPKVQHVRTSLRGIVMVVAQVMAAIVGSAP